MTIKQRVIRYIVFFRMFRQWKQLAKHVARYDYPSHHTRSLVIVPCDPWSVGGSRGDEAMITGVIHYYRHLYPEIPVYIICADNKGEEYINSFPATGIKPVVTWNGPYPLGRIYRSIISVNPTDVVILGADCMDGFYSPDLSLNLLALHDLCTKTSGLRSYLLGFSFNSAPSWLMIRAFRSLSAETRIRLRDDVSLSRYNKEVGHHASLVADAAFMLHPQDDFPLYFQIRKWVEMQRANGNTVIGMNFHPMLRAYSGPEDIKDDAILLAKNIEKILAFHPEVCFVFIPHDDRSRLTDNLMLSTMYEYLIAVEREVSNISQRIFYSPEVPRSSQLKALCGLLDGIVSSRMHLAIAALGMKIPVMAATYQGKFEGLFRHFGLDDRYLLGPQRFLSEEMPAVFDSFLRSLPELRSQIAGKLPYVLELSYSNLKDE